ncbi:MAG: VanZ family protein [Rubrivivax sp.]|nr:VanZ family protein [Rubrivivax sp.]
MTPAPPSPQGRWRWWLAYAAFVVYGSLVPLDWQPLPLAEAWQRFQAIPFLQLGVESRADWVANGVLYVPLGVLGARALAGWRIGPAAGLIAWLLAVVLATAVEFAQLQFPPRTVSQNDLYAEFLGAALGVLLAPRVQGWLDRAAQHWGRDAGRLAQVLLAGYAVAYVLYAFFPYDLLLSRSELAGKLASPMWGWLLAWPEDASPLRVTLHVIAEVAMTVPIGLALRRWSPARGLLAGLLLGLVIELGQLFIASGISQGISVASRGLGVAIGAALAGRGLNLPTVRAALHRHRRLLLLGYLAMLLMITYGRFRWGGWDRAWQNWHELQWLPFYYHYYTTEAIALTSLGATVLMYAPLGALAWARHVSPGAAALVAALLATPVEALRLFMADTRPDPTNVLLAAASVWLLVRLLTALEAQRQRSALRASLPMPARPPRPAPVTSAAMAGASAAPARLGRGPGVAAVARRTGWAWLVLLPVWVLAALWPAGAWVLLPLLVLVAIAVAWLPALALVIVPAALPMLDLAPWTGRFFVDEFDLLCATALAVGLAHTRRVPPAAGTARGVFAAFGLSLAVAALLPLAQGASLDLNSFSHLHSPYNGLRILKGTLWAWLFITLYQRLVARRESLAHWLPWGLVIGLAAVVIVVLWERAAFTGWLDFGTDYRVTGPFSVMNKGGAYIECFLAVSMAFLLVIGARQRGAGLLAAGVLMALASYALFVTYSRNGYAALAVAALVVAPLLWRRDAGGRARSWAGLLLLAVALAAAVPVLTGGFARERLAQIERDFDVRWRHWQLALGLRDDATLATVFGTGLGRFPERHAWHSRDEVRAAGYRLEPGEGNAFLRLAPGATVYVEQIVGAPAGQQDLQLTINLRSHTAAAPVLTLTLCRKWLLTSADCEAITVEGIAAPGVWQTQYATVPPLPAPSGFWQAGLPIKLSLHTPAGRQAVDVDNVSLATAERIELMRNGSFARHGPLVLRHRRRSALAHPQPAGRRVVRPGLVRCDHGPGDAGGGRARRRPCAVPGQPARGRRRRGAGGLPRLRLAQHADRRAALPLAVSRAGLAVRLPRPAGAWGAAYTGRISFVPRGARPWKCSMSPASSVIA